MYDLLLKGGRMIDPFQSIDQTRDVALKDGKIVRISKAITAREAKEVEKLEGRIVTPGLIDLHTHVYWGGSPMGVEADSLGAKSGVTTFVDAGSAGTGNFAGFKEHVIDRSKVRILAFLNISYPGIFGLGEEFRFGELSDIRLANVKEAVQTGRDYPDLIVGIKARLSDKVVENSGIEPLYLAKQAGEILGKPIMIHIGTPPPTASQILPFLRKGDIITHSFRGFPNALLRSDGEILPELIRARKRGVIVDLGHGAGSFSFEVAEKMVEHDFLPDIISSDVHALCIDGPAYDLPTTMSKMYNLGMGLKEVVRSVTTTPAKILGYEKELGSLSEGTIADIAVMEVKTGEFDFYDCFEGKMVGEKLFSPTLTLIKGEIVGENIKHPSSESSASSGKDKP